MAETPMAGHDVDTDDSSREGGLVENPAMWFEDEFKFTNLSPGRHTVSVAVFYDDHTPFSPPVVASKTFTTQETLTNLSERLLPMYGFRVLLSDFVTAVSTTSGTLTVQWAAPGSGGIFNIDLTP